MNTQTKAGKPKNTREYNRLYYHNVIKELGSKTCPHCGKELLCQSSLIKHQKANQKCKMQRMKKEIEQQKQTDMPTVEEIIDENVPRGSSCPAEGGVQQNHENDIHEATTNDSNHPEVEQVDNPAQERDSDNLEIHSEIDVSNLTPTENSVSSQASSHDSNPLFHIDFNRVLSNEFKQVLLLSYQLQNMKIFN